MRVTVFCKSPSKRVWPAERGQVWGYPTACMGSASRGSPPSVSRLEPGQGFVTGVSLYPVLPISKEIWKAGRL